MSYIQSNCCSPATCCHDDFFDGIIFIIALFFLCFCFCGFGGLGFCFF